MSCCLIYHIIDYFKSSSMPNTTVPATPAPTPKVGSKVPEITKKNKADRPPIAPDAQEVAMNLFPN